MTFIKNERYQLCEYVSIAADSYSHITYNYVRGIHEDDLSPYMVFHFHY